MSTRLMTMLQTLAAEPRSEHPILSIYLDWSVDNNGQRQSLAALDQELARLQAEFQDDPAARASLEADQARVAQYLSREAPREARGLIIFACDASRIWVTIPLMVPVETEIAVAHYPYLFQFARILDDHEPFVVALAEGQAGQVFVLALETMEQVEQTSANEKVSHVQVGGWSQARYQRHNEKVIRDHLREMGAAIQEALSEHEARHVIIAGNDAIKGQVRQALPQNIQDLMVDYVAYERGVEAEDLFQNMLPLMQEVERSQEQSLIARLDDQLATKGGLALGGAAAVAQALLKGQVDTLLIRRDFPAGDGVECPTCGVLRPGRRASCPFDGSEMLPLDLRQGLVAHTLRQGGRVEIIGLDEALADHDGVAALLRYRDDAQQELGG